VGLNDVSVVLNIHRDLYRTTLVSLDRCALFAKRTGLKCELVAVFDRSDSDTREAFQATKIEGFDSIRTIEVDHGSLGLSRNAGIDVATGKYIWTADSDDLVSENCIAELYASASAEEKSVNFVNYYIAFGDNFHTAKYYDSSYLTVADFAYTHPYVSRIFVNRKAFEKINYSNLPLTKGLAYEDWDLNAKFLAAGYKFLVARDTIIFYRQRKGSLLLKMNSVSARMPPHCLAFEREWFLTELDKDFKRIDDWQEFVETRQKLHNINYSSEIFASNKLLRYLLDASGLDSEIDVKKISSAISYTPVPYLADHWGYKLAEAYRLVGSSAFTDVILASSLNRGNEEISILDILNEITAKEPEANFLLLCGEPSREHKLADQLPARSTLVDVYNAFPTLSVEDRDRMVARMLLSVSQAGARLHFKSEEFSNRLLGAYGAVLLGQYVGVFYRACEEPQGIVRELVESKQFRIIEGRHVGLSLQLRASYPADEAGPAYQPRIKELESRIADLRAQNIARDAKITELGSIPYVLRQRIAIAEADVEEQRRRAENAEAGVEVQRRRAENAEAYATSYLNELSRLKSKANQKLSDQSLKMTQPLKTIERVIRREVRRIRGKGKDPATPAQTRVDR
jgi:glycosyltransferase involved in cell wall biosynthesis